MTNPLHTIMGAALLIGALLLWEGYRLLVLDWYRQALFDLRDRLFHAGAERSDEYRSVEREINALIRSAHLVNHVYIAPFIVAELIRPLPDRRPRLPPRNREVREVLEEARRQAVMYVVLRTPLVFVAMMIARLLFPRRDDLPDFPTKRMGAELTAVTNAALAAA